MEEHTKGKNDDWIFQTALQDDRPAIFINREQRTKLADHLKLSLVGKIHGRIPLSEIKNSLSRFHLSGEINVGFLSNQWVLLRFSDQKDMNRCWVKGSWTIKEARIRVSKWTPDFRPDVPGFAAPIWISLPDLPCHLFCKDFLFQLVGIIGKPITMDNPTTNLTRPKAAQIAVEIDIRKVLPKEVWIEEDGVGFWQRIQYSKVPPFCSNCKKFGHTSSGCKAVVQGPTEKVYREHTQRGTTGTTKGTMLPSQTQETKLPSQTQETKLLQETSDLQVARQKDPKKISHQNQMKTMEIDDQAPSTGLELIVFNSEKTMETSTTLTQVQISMEDHNLIQGIQAHPNVPSNLIRTQSCPLLRKHWLDGAMFKRTPEPELPSNSDGQTDSIKVQIHFEDQVDNKLILAQTPGKRSRYNLRSLSKEEIYNKRERQNSRRKKKKDVTREAMLFWYSDSDTLWPA